MSKGRLYIISAPSGAGKTSLINNIVLLVDKLVVSISYTTRTQRANEIDGVDYFFTSVDSFNAMIKQQAFLEYAQVFDYFYGTALSTIEKSLHSGKDIILEIDWQGAQQVRRLLPDAISIFILPPCIEALHDRLQERKQDSVDIIERRMQDAVSAMTHYAEYDYLIVNHDFNTALTELKSIILAQRLKTPRQQQQLQALLVNLLA